MNSNTDVYPSSECLIHNLRRHVYCLGPKCENRDTMLHAADRIAGLEARVQELEAAQRRKAASETLSDTGQVVAFGDQIKLQVTDDDELFAVKNVLVTRYKSVGDLRRAVLSTQSDTAPPPPEVEQ